MSLPKNFWTHLDVVDLSVNIDFIQLDDGGLTLRGSMKGLPWRLKVAFGRGGDTPAGKVISETLKNIMKQSLKDGSFSELRRTMLEWDTWSNWWREP